MPRIDNTEFYRSALAAHGETARGLHWQSAYTQVLRFDVLRSFLPADLSAVALADIGCGFGDFYRYLLDQGERPGHYLGLDVMPAMIEVAARRLADVADCEVRLCDALADELPRAQYYVCSGAMNTLTREETRRFIARCYAASEQAFVFNLLKGRDACTVYNQFLPDEIAAIGAELGASVRRRDDYLGGDFSMAFAKTAATFSPHPHP